MTRAMSQTSTVNISDGRALISVNGRVYRVDATDAVSVQVVSDNSGTYVQIPITRAPMFRSRTNSARPGERISKNRSNAGCSTYQLKK